MTEEHTKDELMDANVEIQLWMVEIITMANQMRVNRIPDLSWLRTISQTLGSALPSEGKELIDSLKRVEDCTLAFQDACLEMLTQAEKLAKTMRTGYVCMMRESTDQPVTEIPVEDDE